MSTASELKIYDVIIIGGGPAGYSAALYASRAGYEAVVVERLSAGGQMALTGDIDNYPGFEDGIDGFTLGMKMQQSAERFGAVTKYAEIRSVDFSGEVKRLYTQKEELLARNVIIASGANPRELGVDGEADYIGRGVHYCAHCDGRFYKDKTVAVIGGGNSAAADALYLSKLVKKVYLVHRRDTLRAEKIYADKLFEAENVEFLWDNKVESLEAGERVNAINLVNLKNGEKRNLPIDGVFVSIGRRPATEFLGGALSLDGNGYIIAGEDTKTNIDGVFAVGDVRTKELRQVVTAVADGAVAVHHIK
ncbi:MAG: thioredoxin-disulfide reductase [Clostridia bacterium]|nr:thioredoxin-disulfide reductase [Clostridia bacterium]